MEGFRVIDIRTTIVLKKFRDHPIQLLILKKLNKTRAKKSWDPYKVALCCYCHSSTSYWTLAVFQVLVWVLVVGRWRKQSCFLGNWQKQMRKCVITSAVNCLQLLPIMHCIYVKLAVKHWVIGHSCFSWFGWRSECWVKFDDLSRFALQFDCYRREESESKVFTVFNLLLSAHTSVGLYLQTEGQGSLHKTSRFWSSLLSLVLSYDMGLWVSCSPSVSYSPVYFTVLVVYSYTALTSGNRPFIKPFERFECVICFLLGSSMTKCGKSRLKYLKHCLKVARDKRKKTNKKVKEEGIL